MLIVYITFARAHPGTDMIRTQIYLTEKQRKEITALSKSTGKKQSELIREAVDLLIDQSGPKPHQAILEQAAGMWKDRKDLPDFKAMRAEW